MTQRCSGTAVQQPRNAATQRRSDAVAQRRSGAATQRRSGAVTLCCDGVATQCPGDAEVKRLIKSNQELSLTVSEMDGKPGEKKSRRIVERKNFSSSVGQFNGKGG